VCDPDFKTGVSKNLTKVRYTCQLAERQKREKDDQGKDPEPLAAMLKACEKAANEIGDPENLTNIASTNSEIVKQLGRVIDDWLKQTGPRLHSNKFPP
jgi:hypothetical protein